MSRDPLSVFALVLLAILVGLLLGLSVGARDPGAQRRGLLLLGGAAAALSLSLAVRFRRTRRSRQTLQALIEAANKLSEGAGGQRIDAAQEEELRSLARAFNRMSERLDRRIALLEEERQQLRAILSGMVEGVVALDANQRILYANERAAQLLGMTWQPPVGWRLGDLVRQRSLLDMVRRALESSEPQRDEVSWDGSETRNLTVHAAPLGGTPSRGAVLVWHDTTELRRLERLRQEFVANVSHELKTPLSIIKVCVETLLDGAMDDVQHRGQFLDQIASQSNRLHALILDLLSLARLESGEEVFDLQPVAIEAIARSSLERHRPRAAMKRQTLDVAAPDGEGTLTAWADEEAVEQILDNLLDNAVKYTPEGGRVRVSWGRAGEQIYLEVSDSGIGIPEADLPRIFERFYRVDKARSREMGGTGLGLSIVKHLTQALGGSVQARSRPGHGTTFTVFLPRHAAP